MSHLRYALLAAACSTTVLGAQTLADGYASTALRTLPAGVSPVTVVDDDVVYFTGTRLVLDDLNGTARDLLTFASSVFGSFVIRIDAGTLLFGESSNGGLWRVPLAAGQQASLVANVAFNYDAVAYGTRSALVSAKVGGFASPDNAIVLVDLVTGALDTVARVPGASGPLAIDRGNGTLYYATVSNTFPAPAGSTDLVSWTAQQVQIGIGPSVLNLVSATTVQSGLDPLASLDIDTDGDVFGTDYTADTVIEVNIQARVPPSVSVLAALPTGPGQPDPGRLVFVAGALRRPTFEPFQPRTHVLHVVESTFGGTTQVRTLEPARPTMTLIPGDPVPVGQFELRTTGGPALGTGVLAVGFGAPGLEIQFAVPGYEQLLYWNPTMFLALVTLPVTFDATGTSSLQFVHPGISVPSPLFVTQMAVVSRDLSEIGSAEAIAFRLQ